VHSKKEFKDGLRTKEKEHVQKQNYNETSEGLS